MGIFEVFADTVLLCTITALVILLYVDGEGLDGVDLSLAAYTRLCGEIGGAWLAAAAAGILRLSIVLFAFATVVCQSCYGIEALRYFLSARTARRIYLTLSACAILAGSVISPGVMWQIADLVISLMTCLNVVCLLMLVKKERWGSF
jgi:AGCS family alanine or glycine:cation symporter